MDPSRQPAGELAAGIADARPRWQDSWIIDVTTFEPLAVAHVDVRALEPIVVGAVGEIRHRHARVLAMLDRRPIGFVTVPVVDGIVRVADLDAAIVELVADGVPGRPSVGAVTSVADLCAALAPRPAGPRTGRGLVSVVIPTRNRAESLSRLLDAVEGQHYQDYEVVVVDNDPSDERTRDLISRRAAADARIRYVREPRRGGSAARNRGIAEASGEIVAFADDDTVVDPGWLDAALDALAAEPTASAVTGFVPSFRLDNAVQARFDQQARWSSRFVPALWRPDGGPGASAAYPYTAGVVGAGATYAMRADALAAVGGFDEALGPGTPAHGAEDMDLFARLLVSGRSIAYEPGFIAWHDNRDTEEAFRRQAWGWGVGLSAYITKLLVTPTTRRDVVRRVPAGVAHARSLRRTGEQRLPQPGRARATQLAAWAYGPLAYGRSRRRHRAGARR